MNICESCRFRLLCMSCDEWPYDYCEDYEEVD